MSYIFTSPTPGAGDVIKCEKPIGELKVQVGLLYHHHNFTYGILCKRDRIAYH